MSRTRPLFSIMLILAITAGSLGSFGVPCEGGQTAPGPQPPEVAIVTPKGKQLALVKVELAQTEGQREFGLMYRTHLPEDAGMLFVFSKPQHLTFWMKHTEIPLDMIFADSSGRIVGIVANAKPYSERPLGVVGEAQYVLEVNGGFALRHGIAQGDRLRFIGFTPKALN
jgi:uncharacterized membrane protein (UPF0127 family)